jgi:ABC-type glycerol-3-phosphate transport system permease component
MRNRAGGKSRRRWALPRDLGKHLFLIAAAILTYVPLYILIVTSFKSISQFYHSFWLPEFPLQWGNYQGAWSVVRIYLFNSVFVTLATLVGVLAVSSLASFAFARYSFPGRTVLFYMIISLLMVPFILTLVPAFVWIKQLGLVNTRWGLILPYVAGQQVFAIFLLRGYVASLPEELFEAARIDGASMFDAYLRIALPLSKPMLSVISITTILTTWNDYVWPLVVISDDSLRTITIGLAAFQTQYSIDYGPQMAGYVIASVPLLLLFLFTMRQFLQGLTAGAVKM